MYSSNAAFLGLSEFSNRDAAYHFHAMTAGSGT